MKTVVVGLAECRCSADASAQLVTYSLGSCIGMAAFDPTVGVGGLLHYVLPESGSDPAKAASHPAMFADTGIGLMLDALERLGASRRRLKVRLAGGAQLVDPAGVLNIGRRNYLAARKLLWKHGLILEMEAVGGSVSRHMGLDLASGEIWVKTHPGADTVTAPPALVLSSTRIRSGLVVAGAGNGGRP
jgi:chemotaxis protein CheD